MRPCIIRRRSSFLQAACGCGTQKVRAIAEVDTLVPAIDTEPIRVSIGDGPSKIRPPTENLASPQEPKPLPTGHCMHRWRRGTVYFYQSRNPPCHTHRKWENQSQAGVRCLGGTVPISSHSGSREHQRQPQQCLCGGCGLLAGRTERPQQLRSLYQGHGRCQCVHWIPHLHRGACRKGLISSHSSLSPA